MFREPEEEKVFDTDSLSAAPSNADELNIYVLKCSDAKDTSGPLSSANTLI